MAEYYTLSAKGRTWLDKGTPSPAKHLKVFSSLAGLILDNDVPRTAEQVAHAAEVDVEHSVAGLEYLIAAGFVKHGALPKPSDRGETAKPRIRPVEEIVASEERAALARKRYIDSPKGKQAHQKYEDSPKGKLKNYKYWSDPEKGRLVQKRYRLRRRLDELQAHLEKHPELKGLIQPDIDKAQRRLDELDGGNGND